MMVPWGLIELRDMKMFEAWVDQVELGSWPKMVRNLLAFMRVSAIKGWVKPPLSSWFAYYRLLGQCE